MAGNSTGQRERAEPDATYDVVIVGGGPAGCSAGVFCAREGLDTVIFDRGRSSIKRCAYLENYLGFPRGIDPETFYDLMHSHAETAGCEIVPELVESVELNESDESVESAERADEGRFVVESQEGSTVTARRVVAATRYDGEYLRGLDDEEVLFERYEYDGEQRERFDRAYAANDGTTPVEGLYVASPSEEADTQAVMAAGRGARVAHRVIADAKADEGWWPEVAEGVDWVRREAELDGKWADRENWVEWFDDYYAEDAPVDAGSERFERVREEHIDERLSAYVTDGEIDARTERGHEALAGRLDAKVLAGRLDAKVLAARLDPQAVVEAVDEESLLDAIDDETIREYVDSERLSVPENR